VAGVEIPVGPKVAGELSAGKLMTFGGRAGGWALIEPPFDKLPSDALNNLKRVVDAGFSVVLAHPERNAVIQHDLSFLESCAAIGVNFQLTTGSIIGRMGHRAQSTALEILRRAPDWKIVIASDSHNTERRPPNLMSSAYKAAAEIVGVEEAMRMVDARPRAMVAAASTPMETE
jgi:protein-tyrosine phosphatase